MGRLLKAPEQNFVDLTPKSDIDFYSNILEKAERNLQTSVLTAAQYLDRFGNYTFYSPEDKKYTLDVAQSELQEELDKEFVNPTRLTNKILDINKKISPAVRALKAKEEAVKIYDNLRLSKGSNLLLNDDPRTLSILKEDGTFAEPTDFTVYSVDLNKLDERLLTTQESKLKENRGPLFSRDPNNYPGQIMVRIRRGYSPEELNRLYAPGSELALLAAKDQLKAFPELLNIFKSEEEALNYLMERNLQTVKRHAMEVSYSFIPDTKQEITNGANAIREKQMNEFLKNYNSSDIQINPNNKNPVIESYEKITNLNQVLNKSNIKLDLNEPLEQTLEFLNRVVLVGDLMIDYGPGVRFFNSKDAEIRDNLKEVFPSIKNNHEFHKFIIEAKEILKSLSEVYKIYPSSKSFKDIYFNFSKELNNYGGIVESYKNFYRSNPQLLMNLGVITDTTQLNNPETDSIITNLSMNNLSEMLKNHSAVTKRFHITQEDAVKYMYDQMVQASDNLVVKDKDRNEIDFSSIINPYSIEIDPSRDNLVTINVIKKQNNEEKIVKYYVEPKGFNSVVSIGLNGLKQYNDAIRNLNGFKEIVLPLENGNTKVLAKKIQVEKDNRGFYLVFDPIANEFGAVSFIQTSNAIRVNKEIQPATTIQLYYFNKLLPPQKQYTLE